MTAMEELSSDHNPIMMEIGGQNKQKLMRMIYDYVKVDWKKFKDKLSGKIQITTRIDTTEKLEKVVDKFTNTIQNTIKEEIPMASIQVVQDKLPQSIILEIKNRNKIRKKWPKTRQQQYKQKQNN